MVHPDGTEWRWCKSLPRWYRNGGIYATESTLYGIQRGRNQLVRWKPTIQHVCDSLMGTSTLVNGVRQVKFPTLARRMAIYEEGLNLISVFGDRDDLFTLAVYRRQVRPIGSISLDSRFLELAEALNLSRTEWEMLAARMPADSRIKSICEHRAQ